MNSKKAKALRKLATSMVSSGLVSAGTTYESKTYTRPAVMGVDGTVLQGPYEVKTIRVNPRSERGVYLQMKQDRALIKAAQMSKIVLTNH